MHNLARALSEAIGLIAGLDREVVYITSVSLRFSVTSTLIASLMAVPFSVAVALGKFRTRRVFVVILNTMQAVPTVIVGLFVYSFISRAGVFGRYGLLFTPWGVIIGEVLLIFPVISIFTVLGLSKIDPVLVETFVTLGAGRFQIFKGIISEYWMVIISSIMTGFGRALGELGIAMMVGGNIRWFTRTLTTAIALESSKGEFVTGLALGIILVTLALAVNASVHIFSRFERF